MSAIRDARAMRVEISGRALECIFEECDRYDSDETGGRLVGHFTTENGALLVRALGVIEPGPNARRSPTSFFQDGEYQTEVFRRLEERDPAIEHLGNWHTHHVNGYPTLSTGDIATYRRIVNHDLHNLDFFYALLVTRRREGGSGLDRYAVRHYVLFRGDGSVHEVRPGDVHITDEPRIWPQDRNDSNDSSGHDGTGRDGRRRAVAVRARDQMVLRVMFPSVKPRLSARTQTFFWKGPLQLIGGSEVFVRVVEVGDDDGLLYYPRVSPVSKDVAELCETPFATASEALRAVELRLNGAIHESAIGTEGLSPWRS